MSYAKLEFSIPANNQKIIELYNKLKKEELDPSPAYQRKLVWRKQHKYKFIETILLNFPFPEIYIAPGELNTETLILKDQIVDGQQRLTAIRNYIEGKDVFSDASNLIKKFADLTKTEKEQFLNYEISVRYLKNVNDEQVREIFQRINSTEYALNTTERINAQWGDSEFICFAKQMIEKDLDLDASLINYQILQANRETFLEFFHTKYKVFTENDITRMLALQYILTLLATICEGEYFRRNDKVQGYIENFYDEFINAGEIEPGLITAINFIDSLQLPLNSYWFNKANLFTLVVEVYKLDTSTINTEDLKVRLMELENQNFEYLVATMTGSAHQIPAEVTRYFDLAKEAVNDKPSREYRGQFVENLLKEFMA